MTKAQKGMERLKSRKASIIKESPSKEAAKKKPGQAVMNLRSVHIRRR